MSAGVIEVIDLTLPLSAGIAVYPGDPPLTLSVHADFKDSGCRVSKVEMGLHTGAHVDLPLHYIPQGDDASVIPPDRFIGEAIIMECCKAAGESVIVEDIAGCDVAPGGIVLIRTGWESRAGTPSFYVDKWPGLDPRAVESLVARGVKAIGVDTPSIDSQAGFDSAQPAHKIALGAGIPIYECLVNLGALVGRRFTFIGLPLRIVGAEACPVRAVAITALCVGTLVTPTHT